MIIDFRGMSVTFYLKNAIQKQSNVLQDFLAEPNYEIDEVDIEGINQICDITEKRIMRVYKEFKFLFFEDKDRIKQEIVKNKDLWEKFKTEFQKEILEIQQKTDYNTEKLIEKFADLKKSNEDFVKEMTRKEKQLEAYDRLGLDKSNDVEQNYSAFTSSSSRR